VESGVVLFRRSHHSSIAGSNPLTPTASDD
jgi:hypothetical protein